MLQKGGAARLTGVGKGVLAARVLVAARTAQTLLGVGEAEGGVEGALTVAVEDEHFAAARRNVERAHERRVPAELHADLQPEVGDHARRREVHVLNDVHVAVGEQRVLQLLAVLAS